MIRKLLTIVMTVCVCVGLSSGALAITVQPQGTPSLPIRPVDSSLPVVDSTSQSNLTALLTTYIPRIINFFIGFIAVVAVFIIIWGGYQFLTAQGDMDKAKKAIDIISWSTTGLTIALLAFIIVQIVVNIRLNPA